MKRRPDLAIQSVGEPVTRISASVAAEEKTALEKIVEERRVSPAWLLRDAVTKYRASDYSGER